MNIMSTKQINNLRLIFLMLSFRMFLHIFPITRPVHAVRTLEPRRLVAVKFKVSVADLLAVEDFGAV